LRYLKLEAGSGNLIFHEKIKTVWMVSEDGLILGLVDVTSSINCPPLAAKLRDLTISWARYSYHGAIIENANVDRILDAAVSQGARYCLLLGYGQILREQWLPGTGELGNGPLIFANYQTDDFFVAARILSQKSAWYGIDRRAVLINLRRYIEFDRPSFNAASAGTSTLPDSVPNFDGHSIEKLAPSSGTIKGRPKLPGWRLISESLRRGISIISIDQILAQPVLDLAPDNAQSTASFSRYLGEGIEKYVRNSRQPALTSDQIAFLEDVWAQTQNAKCGIFLFNIEPYTDVEHPPNNSWGPVSTLYSVAAGFKPNKILQTHGFDASTRVVFFDYSAKALQIRKTIIAEWDGRDFPRFVEYLFRIFPHPETFYQLWDGRTPEQVNSSELDEFWHRELQRFGGEKEFANHWNAYRKLSHEFICCDILRSPETLAKHIIPEKDAVIWFSNAPFTVYSNWYHTLEQRKELYDNFIRLLTDHNPEILIYGTDYTNTSVNCISASEYWKIYRDLDQDELRPVPLNRFQIRS
jgi:hypothetical protein